MPYDPVKEHEENQLLRELHRKQYDPQVYQFEKIIGRRTKTGELKLRRLKPLHRQMIAMHIGCFSNRDIAFQMNVDEITVSRVIRDPLSQEIISVYANGIDAELEALLPLGVDVLRKSLLSDSAKIALQGADKLFRALGKFNHTGDEEKRETAEDVIQRALGIAQGSVDIVKEITRRERPQALEIDFERVSDGDDSNSSDKALERRS
ncbi:MAG: hypothetical protein FVQ79_12660 [Planctomycetes bacterium]|nr:hypothetical protein [Planctomycetota bacterium]